MEKFKGTPGPWKLMVSGFDKIKNPSLIQVYATNEDLEMICRVHKDRLLHDKVQDFMSNAQLIAAAPELLEACIEALEAFEVYENDEDIMVGTKSVNLLKKAINKALGQ